MVAKSAAAISRYKSVQVTTCGPGQLIVMLYDGLFRFLNEAQAAIDAKDRGTAGEKISRSHAILEHLLAGLDPEVAPALCEHLGPLYMFCMQRLIQANIKQDSKLLAEVQRVLSPLRDAWKQAAEQISTTAPATAAR